MTIKKKYIFGMVLVFLGGLSLTVESIYIFLVLNIVYLRYSMFFPFFLGFLLCCVGIFGLKPSNIPEVQE